MKKSKLRERCQDMYRKLNMASSHQEFVSDLEAFVISEIGRASSEAFDDSVPLCLYFSSRADANEFVAAVQAAKPGMISKRWPR